VEQDFTAPVSRIASRENHLPRLVRPGAFPLAPPGGLSAPGRLFLTSHLIFFQIQFDLPSVGLA
jgi:hypothetical protein